ncbi:hypothetical protein X975_03610, partial [Stegodyphus mimosarum]
MERKKKISLAHFRRPPSNLLSSISSDIDVSQITLTLSAPSPSFKKMAACQSPVKTCRQPLVRPFYSNRQDRLIGDF